MGTHDPCAPRGGEWRRHSARGHRDIRSTGIPARLRGVGFVASTARGGGATPGWLSPSALPL
ncbi:MAG: hypothetical protein KGS10_12860, partial [Chloroflexi bacterium]|nr:hypothetical protein [Chloroflexota bacterium]